MDISEIEAYLSNKNRQLENSVRDEIDRLRQEAIGRQDEEQANYCWCLMQIYNIKKGFLLAIDDLKNKKYESAWKTFDNIDIELEILEENYDISQENDKFHLMFIGWIIKEYQKLFPYCYFFSRESIIKAEECSICGKRISLRHPCGHKAGKLYMGELCVRKVIDMELKAIAIVTDPFDKYAYLKMEGEEYNYEILKELMANIGDPYGDFYVETVKIKKSNYKNIGRNSLCPCGSGIKYKKCHLDTKDELMDHYIIHMKKSR